MNKNLLRISGLVLLIMVNIFSSCQKEEFEQPISNTELFETNDVSGNLVNRSANAIPNLNLLADTLASRLKSGTIGYSIVVSYKNQASVIRSGGMARTTSNPPSLAMSTNVRYSIASVSKTISAAALINTLNTFPNSFNMIDWPIWTYLPSHWIMGPNIKTITFRDLLQHKSGFRNTSNDGNSCTYNDLKSLVAKGIILSNKTMVSYNNRNFALMRILIPVLAKYNYTKWNPNNYFPGAPSSLADGTQAIEFANAYKDYCRKAIFSKLITCANQLIDCKNSSINPGLFYTFGYGSNFDDGFMEGNLTMSSGGQGWVLSTAQMYDFFKTLHYTDKILPKLLTDLMKSELLGYDVNGTTSDGVSFYCKNGKHLGTGPLPQVYRSLIMGFGDDIQISVMTNSDFNLDNAAIAAHQDWKQ